MNFSGYVGYDTRNNLEYFGDDRFNPLGIGFLFYFLGPCLLATSRNTGWMDIHEIFRIWTQEAIGYTVSRLNRLFHALQTRHGRGLRSQNASCLICEQREVNSGEHRKKMMLVYMLQCSLICSICKVVMWIDIQMSNKLPHLWLRLSAAYMLQWMKLSFCYRQWFVACLAPSHYLNSCWFIVNHTLTNKIKCKLNQSKNNFLPTKWIWRYCLQNSRHSVTDSIAWFYSS